MREQNANRSINWSTNCIIHRHYYRLCNLQTSANLIWLQTQKETMHIIHLWRINYPVIGVLPLGCCSYVYVMVARASWNAFWFLKGAHT